MAKDTNNGANLGFESELWRAADALRSNMDAAEYKHVVLGLIFLKYISDAFEEQHAKLESERSKGADPEDPDEYRAVNIFWVPKEARWLNLKANAKQPTIGKIVDDAMPVSYTHLDVYKRQCLLCPRPPVPGRFPRRDSTPELHRLLRRRSGHELRLLRQRAGLGHGEKNHRHRGQRLSRGLRPGDREPAAHPLLEPGRSQSALCHGRSAKRGLRSVGRDVYKRQPRVCPTA